MLLTLFRLGFGVYERTFEQADSRPVPGNPSEVAEVDHKRILIY